MKIDQRVRIRINGLKMVRKGIFQCGTCNIYEENLTDKEILQLSAEHFEGNHIDVYELRKKDERRKRKISNKNKSKN